VPAAGDRGGAPLKAAGPGVTPAARPDGEAHPPGAWGTPRAVPAAQHQPPRAGGLEPVGRQTGSGQNGAGRQKRVIQSGRQETVRRSWEIPVPGPQIRAARGRPAAKPGSQGSLSTPGSRIGEGPGYQASPHVEQRGWKARGRPLSFRSAHGWVENDAWRDGGRLERDGRAVRHCGRWSREGGKMPLPPLWGRAARRRNERSARWAVTSLRGMGGWVRPRTRNRLGIDSESTRNRLGIDSESTRRVESCSRGRGGGASSETGPGMATACGPPLLRRADSDVDSDKQEGTRVRKVRRW
jgi:hypothetical protein